MNNLRLKIPDYKDALYARFRCWLDKRTFRPHKLRQVLVGAIMTIVVCEVACYRMLQSIVRFGDLPSYVPDMMIILMALCEAIASPFVSWFGYWRRRTIMLVVMPVLVLSTVSWLFLPDVKRREESEFCGAQTVFAEEGLMQSSSVWLGFVLCSCVLFLLARVALWCHGFAYIEEHAPERVSVHLGILVFVRTISLAMDYHMIGVAVRTSQIIGFAINFLIQILQLLYFMPTKTLHGQERLKTRGEDRKFFVSIGRVLSNPLALTQMVSLGLLATAVWGFGYHNSDIIKVKYLIHQKSTATVYFAEVLQYYGILMAVLYIGLKWSVPIQDRFCERRALKQSFTKCILVGGMLLALAGLDCERGAVARLSDARYDSPSCSAHCGCTAAWMEFAPVCVVDDLTTYLSPCHAGCGSLELQGGLEVYTNCTCAGGGRAARGACGASGCRPARELHRTLFVLLLTFGVLGFQSHGVLLLKTVDARDKSVALGLAGSFVSLSAFVVGHIAFNAISGATCVWFESKRCHLHSAELPHLVGWTSGGLAFASALICLVTLLCLLIRARKKEQATRL